MMSDETVPSPPVESVPSVQGGVSAIASANAPFVFFDAVPFFGHANGVGMLTLTAQRHIGMTPDGTVATDNVVTALLRANIPALESLKAAIDGILTMVTPRPEGPLN